MRLGTRIRRALGDTAFALSYGAVKAVSLLPFPVLYAGADAIAWLMYSLVGYRRKVVARNLAASFPDASPERLRAIEKAYYRFLADYFVETLKLASMSEKTIRRRMRVEGIETLNQSVREGRSATLYLGHYCNWEWVSSLPLHIDPAAICGQIYHPLENGVADRIFLRLRSRFGAVSIKKDDTFKQVVGWYRAGRPSVVGYIADQVPGYASIHYWADFLHQDTPVFSGAERIARMMHADTYYLHLTRPRRGYYVCRFERMAADAADTPKFRLTELFFKLLEQQIEENPPFWLWSHNRWKRTRAEWLRRYPGAESAKRLTRL